MKKLRFLVKMCKFSIFYCSLNLLLGHHISGVLESSQTLSIEKRKKKSRTSLIEKKILKKN